MSGTLVIERSAVLVDEPVDFSVVGCVPGERVAIAATWRIGDEDVRTEGRFVVPSDGVVVPGLQESVGGTYVGVEPYGLWWSIDRPDVPEDPEPLSSWSVLLTASGTGWETSGSLRRLKVDPSVRQIRVDEGRLRGIAFLPEGEGPFPSVLVYSGSGGGLGGLGGVQSSAALLASRGFAALALAYFRYEDLPSALVEIPLEYFHEGIEWLADNAPAAGGRVAVMGASRGGELSLLLGSTYPDEIAAVVAKVPSGVVWGGFGGPAGPETPAWTLGDKPIRPLSSEYRERDDLPLRDGAIELTPGFEASLANASPEDFEAGEIAVERVGGPVLLLSGEDDAMWPSVAMSEIAVRRARDRGADHPFRHLRYSDAGHAFAIPSGFPVARSGVHPVSDKNYAYGGSLVGNAHASIESWREILAFLHANLLAPGRIPSDRIAQ